MKIIIDTNIIFSALLNSNSKIGDLLFLSEGIFEFYSCNYMRYEIKKHWKKLLKISALSESNLIESHSKVLSKIHFINEELIPEQIWISAEKLVEEIDLDDIDFVALTIHLNGILWTGDKHLLNGLLKKDFDKIFDTNSLIALRRFKSPQ